MKQNLKNIFKKTGVIVSKSILYGLLLLVVLAGLVVFLYWQTNWVAKAAEKYINYTLADSARVKYGSISGSLINTINIDSLQLDFRDKFSVKSRNIKLNYDLWSIILDKKIIVSSVYIDSIAVELIQKTASSEAAKPFNLDSLLYTIQHSHLVDTILAKAPQLALDDFEIVTGYLHVVNQPLSFDNISLNFNAYFMPDNFEFRLKKLTGYWRERDFKLDNLQFQVIGSRDRITINQFQFESGETHFTLAAEMENEDLNTLLFIEDFYIDPASFSGFITQFSEQDFLQGKISFIGNFQDFGINTKLNGRWQQHELDALNLTAEYNFGTIQVDTFWVKTANGELFASTFINTTSSARGRIAFNNFNLNAFKPDLAQSSINGQLFYNIPPGYFNINKLAETLKNISGTGSLEIYPSFYENFTLDSLRFALKSRRGNIQVVQPSFIKFANHARFDMYGELKRNRELDFQIHSDLGDLNSLTTAIGLDSMYGNYYTDFRAFGNLQDPQLKGYFWISDFKFYKIFLDSVGLNIDLKNVITSLSGKAGFQINKGSAYDIPVRDAIITAEKNENKISIPTAKIFSNDNYIETNLDILLNPDSIKIDIAKLRLEYEKYWLQNQAPINVVVDSRRVAVHNFVMNGPDETHLNVDGFYDKVKSDATAQLDLETINLAPFRQFLGEKHKASGIISGFASLKSILQNPQITLDLKGTDIEYRDVTIGNFTADMEYDTSKVFIHNFNLESGSSKINATGDLDIRFDMKTVDIVDMIRNASTNISINWENINLYNYNPLLQLEKPLAGKLDGYLEIEGTVGDPFMRQSLKARQFRYGKIALDSLIMFGQYSAGYLILDSLSTTFQGTDLAAKGWQQIDLGYGTTDTVFSDNPFEFFVFSKDNNMSFLGMFNDQLESISGDYDLEIYVTGTPEKPGINRGQITLDNGNILLSRVKDPITNVNADITIEDNILTINRFDAKSEKEEDFLEKTYNFISKLWTWMLPKRKENGVLAVSGNANLENIFRPKINFDIEANKFFVDYFVENTQILLSSDNLNVSGRDTLNLTGKILIPFGEYEVNVDQMQKNMYLQEVGKEKGPPYIAMNLEIEIPGNFVVTSSPLDLQNNFKIIMLGNLTVTQEAGSDNMRIIGSLQTESGTFTSFNQRFNVTSGTIDFSNPLQINPEFNITAQKNVRDKIFELVINGNLEIINQNIIVRNQNGEELNLTPQDKIAMLTLGTDVSGIASNTDSTLYGVGEDVAKNTLITAATRGVEELTGLDRVEINSTDKIIDLQKMKLNNGLKEASISFGKYLTSDLYVEYKTQFGSGVPTPKLSWDAGNKISLQYRINQQWSLQSNYEKTIPLGNNKIQLGLSWEYRF